MTQRGRIRIDSKRIYPQNLRMRLAPSILSLSRCKRGEGASRKRRACPVILLQKSGQSEKSYYLFEPHIFVFYRGSVTQVRMFSAPVVIALHIFEQTAFGFTA